MNERHWGSENWILDSVATYGRVFKPYLMGLIQLHQNKETLEWVPVILELLLVCLSKDDFDILYCYVRADWNNSNINKKLQWQSVVFSYSWPCAWNNARLLVWLIWLVLLEEYYVLEYFGFFFMSYWHPIIRQIFFK